MKTVTIAAVAALALAGCSADGKSLDLSLAPVTLEQDNTCSTMRKVRWSVDDTPETIDDARRHNARIDRLCRKPKPTV